MAVRLLNDFLLGADPELVLLQPPNLVRGSLALSDAAQARGAHYYGFDHNGYVLEPHPVPSLSARGVCRAIKDSLDTIACQFDGFKQRAGAYLTTPQRAVTLGGHVHLDLPNLNRDQINAMDVFAQSLERLEILPAAECTSRRSGGDYGRWGDIRAERGRVEYRSLCSWLFSRKASMLSITGIKLCAVAPRTLKAMTSIKEMVKWFEGFKGADDDVDWILDRGYFESSLEAKPDSSVASVWRADPERGAELLKGVSRVQTAVGQTLADLQRASVEAFLDRNPEMRAARDDFARHLRAQINAQSSRGLAGNLGGALVGNNTF